MNIEDFKPIDLSLEQAFAKQKEIKFLYEPDSKEIFEHFDIDTYEDQEIFKRYCWRITEELMEAMEDQQNGNHFKEELIDGFNFMMELYLLCGWEMADFVVPVQTNLRPLEDKILSVIYQLGITANTLKNRQWRQSQYLVDLYTFEKRLRGLWPAYIQLFVHLGMGWKEILDLWSLKYQVNLFRINSNY